MAANGQRVIHVDGAALAALLAGSPQPSRSRAEKRRDTQAIA
jgi:hypothetical protein